MSGEADEEYAQLYDGKELEGTARIEFLNFNEVMEGPCTISINHVGLVAITVVASIPLFARQVPLPFGVDLKSSVASAFHNYWNECGGIYHN